MSNLNAKVSSPFCEIQTARTEFSSFSHLPQAHSCQTERVSDEEEAIKTDLTPVNFH